MWIYTSKDGTRYAIPYYNIDYVVLSTGEFTEKHSDASKRGTYYHSKLKEYYQDEVLTILYRRSGDYNLFVGEVAFNQLAITPEHKFVCDKN
jgi:hypothetical protein